MNHSWRKKLLATLLCLLMCFQVLNVFAENQNQYGLDLSSYSDEQLEEIIDLVKQEQRSRIVTAIELDMTEVSLAKGKSQNIKAQVVDLEEGVKAGKFEWSSDNEEVATVKNGSVRAVNAGKATIKCSSLLTTGIEIQAVCSVEVYVPVQSLAVENKNMEVMSKDALVPSFVIKPEDATNKDVIYTIEDESILTVDESNRLLGVKAGKTNVTANAADGSGKAVKFTVTVTKLLGNSDKEIKFNDLEWGSDALTCLKKLQLIGLVREGSFNDQNIFKMYGDVCYWPKDVMHFSEQYGLPRAKLVYKDDSSRMSGAFTIGSDYIKDFKVEGYQTLETNAYFTDTIENGKLSQSNSHLYGVEMKFHPYPVPGQEIFANLLTKLEEQYGEFDKYVCSQLGRNPYAYMADFAKSMKDAKKFDDDHNFAFCILKGMNDTGIVLLMDSLQFVYLYYGKTDSYTTINEIQAILDEVPDTSVDVGL